ncbi:MAG: acyltransferase family protein, partial [Pseudomonadota bacterium]|nr:acyltransferase family protein [Pseudomonadota bacterium]
MTDRIASDNRVAVNRVAVNRVDWVDVAKGICIIMVVMMHSTLGVEKAMGETGWMGYAVEFARPFRMPDFFLIAGLFLAARINAPWRLYLDRK